MDLLGNLGRSLGLGFLLAVAAFGAGKEGAAPLAPATPEGDDKLAALVGKTAPEFRFLLRNGAALKLADYQGRWIAFEFGGTGNPQAEDLGIDLTTVRKELDGQAFDFIRFYTDPSWDDVDLGTPYEVTGLQAMPDKDGIPAAYAFGFAPWCLLIDPKGTVVWVDGHPNDATLRAALAKKIGTNLKFPDGFAKGDPYRADQEKAAAAALAGNRPVATRLWQALLTQRPNDSINAIGLVRSLLDAKEALTVIDDRLAAFSESGNPAKGPLEAEKASVTAYSLGFPDAAPLYAALSAKYPASFRLHTALIAMSRPPDGFTDGDRALFRQATTENSEGFARIAGAYALEARGETAAAEALHRGFTSWMRIHTVGFLARTGRGPEALALLEQLDGHNPPDPGDRAGLWKWMCHRLVAQDWASAGALADLHARITPQNALGPVVRLLAAVRANETGAKEDALAALAAFKTDRLAYLYGQQVQRGEIEATPDTAVPIAHDRNAFVGLLWAGAVLEAQGKYSEAKVAYSLDLNNGAPFYDDYAVLYSVRAGLVAKPALATPPTPLPTP